MKYQKALIISDIHGCYSELVEVLKYWEKDMLLIFLGDYVHRGPRSYEVVQLVRQLKLAYPHRVVTLRGNHDQNLLDFLTNPTPTSRYLDRRGQQTLQTFMRYIYPLGEVTNETLEWLYYVAKNEINFLQDTLFYYEWGNNIFVHGGLPMGDRDWKTIDESYYLFNATMYAQKNTTGKQVIFGHISTHHLHGDSNNHCIWKNAREKYVGIDGGCDFGGQLNAIILRDDGLLLEELSCPSKRPSKK